MDADLLSVACSAFPAALSADVRAAAQTMPETSYPPAGTFDEVWVRGEHLTIPGRLYNPEPADDLSGRLSAVQVKILHCLYTRHHDGYVRQHHLREIIDATDPWVVPFVVQLIGEYVLDIVITIKEGLADLDLPGSPHHQAYGRFAAGNSDYVFLTSQRVASYWNCYYRGKFPHRSYPGRILIDSLNNVAATCTEPAAE
jgi:hypothetical protein